MERSLCVCFPVCIRSCPKITPLKSTNTYLKICISGELCVCIEDLLAVAWGFRWLAPLGSNAATPATLARRDPPRKPHRP
eukprot:scaffold124878_cov63-Phaeocystis_antarctica.AAC.9